MAKYTFREGTSIRGVDPNAAAKELERIREKHGNKLMPRIIVAEAKAENSPIHNAFEWRNGKAAELYRIHQARNLVRAIRVIDAEGVEKDKWVHVKPIKEEGYYQEISVAVQNVDEYRQALQQAMIKQRGAERAVTELLAAAKQLKRKKDMAYIGVAVDAMATARNALEKLPGINLPAPPSQPEATM